MRYRLLTMFLGMLFAGMFLAQPVSGSDYPNRPITLMTMVEPGAQIDLLARGLSERLEEKLGQPVTVDNTPGGSHGSVMAAELSNADPDGYTLGLSATAAVTYTPHYVPTDYSFDDFEFISKVGLNQSGIVALPDRPYDTVKEAFEWARENDEALTYMFQGSDDRDALQRIAEKEDVRISLMPSTGGPSVISAVKGGHADLGHLGAILFDYVEAGELNLLAASTPERLTEIPDVPTLQEQGYDETVEMFVVLMAPAGTPEDRIARVEEAMLELEEDDEFQEFVTEELIMAPVPYGQDYAKDYMKEAYERFEAQAEAMR